MISKLLQANIVDVEAKSVHEELGLVDKEVEDELDILAKKRGAGTEKTESIEIDDGVEGENVGKNS